jgi:hypothetical protein
MSKSINIPASLLADSGSATMEQAHILNLTHQVTQLQMRVLMAINDLHAAVPGEDSEVRQTLQEVRRYLSSALVILEPVRQRVFQDCFEDIPF